MHGEANRVLQLSDPSWEDKDGWSFLKTTRGKSLTFVNECSNLCATMGSTLHFCTTLIAFVSYTTRPVYMHQTHRARVWTTSVRVLALGLSRSQNTRATVQAISRILRSLKLTIDPALGR